MHNQQDDDASKLPADSNAPDTSNARASNTPISSTSKGRDDDANQSIINSLNQVPKFSREWFQLKEREISIRNTIAADDDDAGENANANDEGLESLPNQQNAQVNANNSLENVNPIGINNASVVEVLMDNHTPMPATHVGAIHRHDENDEVKQKMKCNRLEQIIMPLESSPVPMCSYEKDDRTEKKRAAAGIQQPSVSNDECDDATNESGTVDREADGVHRVENTQFTSRQIQFLNRSTKQASSQNNGAEISQRLIMDIEDQRQTNESSLRNTTPNQTPLNNETGSPRLLNTYIGEAQRQTDISSLGNTTLNPTILDLDASISVIPEAFLVEEEEKVITEAELILPWWKRKRFYAAILIILLIVISSIVGGVKYVQLSSSQKEIVFVMNETTAAPSISSAPTSSQMPSFQPSACVDQSSLDPERLEFVFFNMSHPLTAIEGEHSVIVDIHLESRSAYMYVVFYKLTKFGTWDKAQHFVELLSDGNDTDLCTDPWMYNSDLYWDDEYSLAMSNNVVMIGTPFVWNGTGIISAYEYNGKIGEWLRINEPIKPDNGDKYGRRFGQSIAIDDDLAVISAPGDDMLYIFLRDDQSWNQMTTISMANTTSVVVNDNTIGLVVGCQLHLYIYDRKFDLAIRNQQFLKEFCYTDDGFGGLSLDIGSVVLSANHLAVSAYYGSVGSEYSDNGCWNPYLRAVSLFPLFEITLYYRPDESRDFTFVQMLNSSDYDQGFSGGLALDDDFLMVAGAGNQSHAFVYTNEFWEESLALTTPDRCGYDGYSDTLDISGRRVMLTTTEDVYIYNVDECATMPTSAPSESPSSNPTTECFMIEIYAQHYHALTPTWVVERMNETLIIDAKLDSGSSIPTLRPTWGVMSVVGYDPLKLTMTGERKCLEEGIYKFTIYKDPLYYNLTSYGNVIVEGYEPGYKESTIFRVPLQID